MIWNYHFADPEDSITIALKQPFSNYLDETEDLVNRSFPLLHRIIFGLTTLNLESQLQATTTGIDDMCSVGRTALLWASSRKDTTALKSLLRHGAGLHFHDWRGQNAFHLAAECESAEPLKLLLQTASRMAGPNTSVDFDTEHQAGEASNLSSPASHKSSIFFHQLLEARDYKGRTALHLAVRLRHMEHVRLLLDYGAYIDSPDTALDRTPLMNAIYWNQHQTIRLLLKRGAMTNVVDRNRMTILHYAAKYGDFTTLNILGKAQIAGVKANVRDLQGRTAIESFELRKEYLVQTEEEHTRSRMKLEDIVGASDLAAGEDNVSDSDESESDNEEFFDAVSSLEPVDS